LNSTEPTCGPGSTVICRVVLVDKLCWFTRSSSRTSTSKRICPPSVVGRVAERDRARGAVPRPAPRVDGLRLADRSEPGRPGSSQVRPRSTPVLPGSSWTAIELTARGVCDGDVIADVIGCERDVTVFCRGGGATALTVGLSVSMMW